MSIFKRTQRKYVKKAYRVRNWREYEAGLRNRGSLTVWISLTAGKLVNWDAPRPRRRKPGRQRKYSNHAIETAVTLGMVFHLSSRQSEGLLRSLFALMKLDNDVPDHTTISRRKAKLGKVPFYQDKHKTPLLLRLCKARRAARGGRRGFRLGDPVLCQNSALLKDHGCNLMHCKVLASFCQHLMVEAPMRSV